MFIDGEGRKLEVVLLDRGHGPQPWVRVSWHHGILLGAGYYRAVEEALAFVDTETLVEVIELPRDRPLPAHRARGLNERRRPTYIPHVHDHACT